MEELITAPVNKRGPTYQNNCAVNRTMLIDAAKKSEAVTTGRDTATESSTATPTVDEAKALNQMLSTKDEDTVCLF